VTCDKFDCRCQGSLARPVVWCGLRCGLRCGLWCGAVRCSAVRCRAVRCGVVWCGLWCGVQVNG
jgi:hypothetical protein